MYFLEKYGKIKKEGGWKYLKKIFYTLAVIGILIIMIIAFVVPKNPYEMIPSILYFDKPLWLCIAFFGCFLYLLILRIIYSKIKKRHQK